MDRVIEFWHKHRAAMDEEFKSEGEGYNPSVGPHIAWIMAELGDIQEELDKLFMKIANEQLGLPEDTEWEGIGGKYRAYWLRPRAGGRERIYVDTLAPLGEVGEAIMSAYIEMEDDVQLHPCTDPCIPDLNYIIDQLPMREPISMEQGEEVTTSCLREPEIWLMAMGYGLGTGRLIPLAPETGYGVSHVLKIK